MDGYIGTITLFAGNFAPRNWAFCRGQMLAIASNSALYSIIGTYYGGDGRVSFALPNLGSRVPVGTGQSPGYQPYTIGQAGGVEFTALTEAELPQHTHENSLTVTPTAVNIAIPSVTGSDANVIKPNSTAVMGKVPGGATFLYSNATPDGNMKPFDAMVTPSVTINNASAGAGEMFDNRPPFLALNYIICTEGLYPARN